MKKSTYLILLFASLFFANCEEVVDVNLDTAPPRLVVEATIQWQKGTLGNNQFIKLTTTTAYFSNTIPTVSNATVYINDSNDIKYTFTEKPNTGEYYCTNFVPVLDQTYVLTVIYKGQTYTATESLKSVAPISRIEQNDQGGFSGNEIEIKSYFNDPADQDNFYLYHYGYANKLKSIYYVDEDRFYQGNEFFSISQNDEIKKGDAIEITHYGISKAYYNYLSVLLSIAGQTGGGPFQSPPATVRGNLVNTTDGANYALGYFSLSETDTKNYTVQ